MKIFKSTLFTLAIAFAAVNITLAQQTKKDKEAAKEAKIKQMVDAKDFTFTAQSVNPMRGGTRNLTSDYDLRIAQDSVIAYLPFFGRAYIAPINPDDAGLKFTSTRNSFVATQKKSGYEIVIKPEDTKEVRQMVLTVSSNGYGTLSVTNTNRDPISFCGYVEANKKPKK